MAFTIRDKSTVTVQFDQVPDVFNVYKVNGELYHFRRLDSKPEFKRVKFNVPNPGTYRLSYGKVTHIAPISITPLKVELPPHQREREKKPVIVVNPELKTTPARNFTEIGRIEVSPLFKTYPDPVKLFILLHEYGHFFYKDEELCDLYAAKKFVEMGYNNSIALYSLTNILQDNDTNYKRIHSLFSNLKR